MCLYGNNAPAYFSCTNGYLFSSLLDMISDNDPVVSKFISVPKDVSQLNCGAFMAGIVEAIMDGCQFVGPFAQLVSKVIRVVPKRDLDITTYHLRMANVSCLLMPFLTCFLAIARNSPYGANRRIPSADNHSHQARQGRAGAGGAVEMRIKKRNIGFCFCW